MRALKIVPAKRYRMQCLTAMLAGTLPNVAIVTTRDAAEAAEMQELFMRAWNPTPHTPKPKEWNLALEYRPPYCTCAEAKRNRRGACKHNSIYLRK